MSDAWNRAMGRGAQQRKRERSRRPSPVPNKAPWRKVVWIGVDRSGRQGGQAWMLVLECGHVAIRPLVQPAEHRIFRRIPGAPKRCRCLSCELGTEKADPQIWIDTLIQAGKEP